MKTIDADAIPWQECLDTNGYAEPLDKMIAVIQNMPTVEAEPRKGKWIWDKENDKMYCSECGYETDNWGVHQESDPIEWQLPNYCENCGSDNREVEE